METNGRLLTLVLGLLLSVATWVRPEAGIMLQIAWLAWIGYCGVRRGRWFLLEAFLGLFVVHYLTEVRGQGEEGWFFLLDIPFQLVALYLVWLARKERPWWVTLLATSPLVHWPLVIFLYELGLIPQLTIRR